jgi:hypothetical protein
VDLTPDRLAIAGLVVHRAIVAHPLLGDAHVIEHAGRAITAMSAIDWLRPTRIPTVAEPARLPPGTGGALVNAIATLAERAGVRALRYAGPYPTPALYRTLLRSFRASADEATFTADVLGRAARLASDELPVDFAPAPHRRVEIARGHVELRDHVERVVIDGASYERDGSPTRLARTTTGVAAEVWFGDAPWARIAALDASGALIAGPHAPPPCASPVVGAAFPPALRAALAELIADAVPSPLADDARAAVTSRSLAWADLGVRAARRAGTGFEVHAALWDRLAPFGLARLALALAEALVPTVVTTIIAEVVERRDNVAVARPLEEP